MVVEVIGVHYKRLRNLREDHDMTQKELARLLDCSQRIYSNYERGDVNIPTDILIKLSRFYNTSIDYLLDQTDVKEPYARRVENNHAKGINMLQQLGMMLFYEREKWGKRRKILQKVSLATQN